MYALNSNFTTLCIDLTLTHKALLLKCATPNCFCLADFRLLKTVGLGVPSIAYSIQSGMVWVGNSIKSNPGGGGFNWTLLYRKNAVGPIRVVGTRPKHSCCEPALLLLCTHVCGYKLNTQHTGFKVLASEIHHLHMQQPQLKTSLYVWEWKKGKLWKYEFLLFPLSRRNTRWICLCPSSFMLPIYWEHTKGRWKLQCFRKNNWLIFWYFNDSNTF